MAEQEPVMSAAVLAGIGAVLDEIRAAVMTATGVPNLAAWNGTSVAWETLLNGPIADMVERIIGHVLAMDGYRSSTLTYARQHLQTVWSRLKDWPTEAWAEVAAALDAGIADGLDARGLRERVGDALNVTALTRTAEAEMERLYDRIEAGVSPATESELRARIRDLANTADHARRRWEWRADRIARTEVAAAVNAGVAAYAAESEAATGRAWWKQWWSSQDSRVRPTHRAAHGQLAPPGGRFTVGGAALRYPGDPLGPPTEVINCRCSTLLLTAREAETANA
jgi:uncharacterized protein with gpF-like domain